MSNAFIETVSSLRKQGLGSDQILKKLEEMSVSFPNLDVNNEQICKETEEEKIKNFLDKLCIPIHFSGYQYWIDAIKIYKNNRAIQMMELYQVLSEKKNATAKGVERSMRYAIIRAFDECPASTLNCIFEHNISSITGKPTNTQFLRVMAREIM